jgi:hypothetical protein
MYKIGLFAVAGALILAGVGTWAAPTTHARFDTPVEAHIDPSQMMIAKVLPAEHYVDYSLMFN